MYNYIIPLIIIIIIGIVLYFRYNTKEGFQVDASANSVNMTTIKIIQPDISVADLSGMSHTDAANEANSVIAPLIAANPELQGVFANDQVSILTQPTVPYPPVDPKYTTTAPDRRSFNDVGRQCDIAKTQLKALTDIIDTYKASHSWPQVRGMNKSIEAIQDHINKLGC